MVSSCATPLLVGSATKKPQGQLPASFLQFFRCKRIMLRLLVTFSFPRLPIKQLLVPLLQTEPTETSGVCVLLAEEKEKEECRKGNGLLQTQMIRPLVCDLGFNIQLSLCKKPPEGKKKFSQVDQVRCWTVCGAWCSSAFSDLTSLKDGHGLVRSMLSQLCSFTG